METLGTQQNNVPSVTLNRMTFFNFPFFMELQLALMNRKMQMLMWHSDHIRQAI